ncbi:feruloyl-CoA synthase [Sinisalibacter aestuarii]|uniref:Feruloyl-CoA synthase n=1 Tax=Sinisalibacter aestuarii TaxID=2949426 RepID=A0ABQ5LQ40_9RHOB|nr:feruloyl-CoA synthase [Sinisalibacter aestuarii]GKY86863.1 feruloyl-CoA synthase [Sinisalibacter aestuarii]
MTKPKLRPVKLWDAEIATETRADGAVIVRQTGELGPYPRVISERIEHWAAVAPDRIWMAERAPGGGDWQRVSYGALLTHIRAIGQYLLGLGLSTDRPLVILSGNSISHALMALGAQYVGIPSAALAPAYALVSKDYAKLHEIRDQITPGAVFADDLDRFAPAMDAAFPGLPRLGLRGAGANWEEILATVPTAAVDTARAATGPETVAKFMFTSGTTGSPKAVIQTQKMLCVNMEQVYDCYAYLKEEPPIILDWAPWNHVAAGNLMFNVAIWGGGTFHIDGGRPTPDGMAETIRNLRDVATNWYFNVPVGFEMLLEAMQDDPALAAHFFSSVKLLYYAGAAMAQHTWDELKQMAIATTGEEILLASGLGATETAPFALFQTEPQASPGNIGVPAKGLTLKLVPNDGKWEARVKGPNVTPGYWRNEELTRDAFDDEGFYRLGDALRFADPDDAAKGFFFDGRVAENFKMSTGTWVAVGALRARLIDALGGLARDVVIVGEGEDELGILIVPFRPAAEKMLLGSGALDDATLWGQDSLRDEISGRLAAYNAGATGASLRVPRAMVMIEPLDLDRGEVTDKGSVNQRAVRSHRADLVAALYSDDPRVIRA